jgi:regulator of sigma E protease
MPAEGAGIEAGDLILAVDGERPATWFDLVLRVRSAGDGPVRLELQRGQEVMTLDVEPHRSPIDGYPMIGILPGRITVRAPGLLARAQEAVTSVVGYGRQLFQLLMPAPNRVEYLTGPIGISSMAAERAGGVATFWHAATYFPLSCLWLCIVLPYLDGRRFLFLLVEGMARRPIHPKYEQRFNLVWLVIVAGLDVVASVSLFVP